MNADRRSPVRSALAFLCVLCGELSAVTATPPAVVEDLARSLVNQQITAQRLRVRRDLLDEALRAPRLRNSGRDDGSLPNLRNAAVEFRAVCSTAERDWLAARADLWAAELVRFDRSLESRDSGAVASVLHWCDRAGWWAGPPAVVLLILVVIYDGRHLLRRTLGAYAGLAVVLFVGAIGLGTAAGMSVMLRSSPAPSRAAIDPPHERFNAEIAAATRDRTAMQTEVDQLEHDLAFDSQSPGDNEARKL